MSDTVIKVEGLSKKYRIGSKEEGYKTFRETLVDAAKAPFKRIKSAFESVKTKTDLIDETNIIWALKDVSFKVKQGQVVGIIGKNGAGKSTLLKILSQITEPTEGRIELRGRVGSLLEVGTGFHPELTGHENIYLYGAILGMDRWEVTRKFDEIVAFAELSKFIETPVKRYSTGMYMRLAFAVAAHLEPEILLVDEVLAVGDAQFQKKCLGKMGDVSKEGRTVLFVSHNMPAVLNLCEHAILLVNGQVANSDTTEKVVTDYLAEGMKSIGQVFLTPQEGGKTGEFSFSCTSVLNPINSDVTTQLTLEQGVDIEIEYEIIVPIKRLVIIIELWDSSGTCVLSSTDKDQDPSTIDDIRNPGAYYTKCQIPNNLLRPGRYYISLRASIPMVRILADLPSLLAFDILDIDSLPTKIGQGRRGVVSPVLSWYTQKKGDIVQC